MDLDGRVCLVAGANPGIGLETCRALAGRGATVWMFCREPRRGRQALQELRRTTGAGRLHLAGVLPNERLTSVDDHEITLATPVLGPWPLTRLLAGRLQASDDARVVLVSSGGMYTQRLSLDGVQWRRRPCDGVAAMHPGRADTPAVRSSLPPAPLRSRRRAVSRR